MKYKIGDILFDTKSPMQGILGIIHYVTDTSYILKASNGKIVNFSIRYIDNDIKIRLATKAEEILYVKF